MQVSNPLIDYASPVVFNPKVNVYQPYVDPIVDPVQGTSIPQIATETPAMSNAYPDTNVQTPALNPTEVTATATGGNLMSGLQGWFQTLGVSIENALGSTNGAPGATQAPSSGQGGVIFLLIAAGAVAWWFWARK